jgi:gluconokinase
MIADMFNKPVRLRPNFHSVSFGAFLLSATEMGLYRTLDEAAQKVELPEVYKPQKENHGIYAGYFGIFEKLTAGLSEQFEAIATLQQKDAAAQKRSNVNKKVMAS